MTQHLEWHQHAFLNEDGMVIEVPVFDESAHDSDLLLTIKEQFGASEIICCCEHGITSYGAYWINGRFTGIKDLPSFILDEETYEWVPPIPKPTDGKNYWWNEDTLSWIEIEEPTE
jgi:hypothetical protein